MKKHPVVVAISGGGRSLENLLRHQQNFAYEVVGVASSNESCRGIEIAAANRLPVYQTGNNIEAAPLTKWLAQWPGCWVALAGFLRFWPDIAGFSQRTVNIHPALLPRFGGKGMYGDRVHAAVLQAGEKESGASIHFVTPHYDEGNLISRIRVPVRPGDTVATLATRVFAAECDMYPDVLDKLVTGRLPEKDVFDYGLREC